MERPAVPRDAVRPGRGPAHGAGHLRPDGCPDRAAPARPGRRRAGRRARDRAGAPRRQAGQLHARRRPGRPRAAGHARLPDRLRAHQAGDVGLGADPYRSVPRVAALRRSRADPRGGGRRAHRRLRAGVCRLRDVRRGAAVPAGPGRRPAVGSHVDPAAAADRRPARPARRVGRRARRRPGEGRGGSPGDLRRVRPVGARGPRWAPAARPPGPRCLAESIHRPAATRRYRARASDRAGGRQPRPAAPHHPGRASAGPRGERGSDAGGRPQGRRPEGRRPEGRSPVGRRPAGRPTENRRPGRAGRPALATVRRVGSAGRRLLATRRRAPSTSPHGMAARRARGRRGAGRRPPRLEPLGGTEPGDRGLHRRPVPGGRARRLGDVHLHR